MEEFKGNSNKSKMIPTEKEKAESVVVGNRKKKGTFEKTLSSFLAEDVDKVKEYVYTDIIKPKGLDLIYTIFTGALSMLLFGKSDHRSGNSNTKSSIYTWNSYNNCYPSSKNKRPEPESKERYDYDDVIFKTRGDAEQVLIAMGDILERYEMVSIGDFYDLSGITGQHTDYNYGWKSLSGADFIRVPDGVMIKFPKAIPLNN